MDEEKGNLSVYVMQSGDVKVGLTGDPRAPIVLVIPKALMGLGLTSEVAEEIHNGLCNAISMLQDESDALESEFSEIPKNKLN